jgi:membrane-associated protein
MELISKLIDLFLHLDKHLNDIIGQYGEWTYLILFLIVFARPAWLSHPSCRATRCFRRGSVCGSGIIERVLAFRSFVDRGHCRGYNQLLDRSLGRSKNFHRENVRFLNKNTSNGRTRLRTLWWKDDHHRALCANRRTFAPFVAGIGSMGYGRFIAYNIIGGVAWVAICVFSGFYFGNLEIVKNNFSLVIIAIVLISVLPMLIEYIRHRLEKARSASSTST